MPCRWEARAEAPATPELRRDRGWSPPSPLARRLASRSPVSRRRGLAHDSGMGQVLSIPFISKTSLSAAAAARARRRKKKGKKRNNLWKSIVTTVFSLFGRNPTSGAIQAKESTPTDGKIESERKEVAQFYAENHSHIVCEHSRGNFTSVISFLAGKDKFKSVDVPGKKDKSGKKVQIKVAREVVRRILIGIFIRFRHLHSEGKTLNGCFTAENICVPVYKKDEDILMAPYIEVKLDSLHPDSFQAYTDDGGNKDLMRVGWILENSIFSSETEVPSDLKHLLELLHSDPIVNKNLIYSHVCLMGPRDQISYYHWLYKRLVYLKKKVPNSYKNIMQKIAADDWKSKAESNEFLAMLHPSSRYSKDGKGLSHFYRNSVEHLFKVIEDQKRNSASMVEEELQDYHIVYILTEAFPQFLADLQKAFYEEGELDTFNREDSA